MAKRRCGAIVISIDTMSMCAIESKPPPIDYRDGLYRCRGIFLSEKPLFLLQLLYFSIDANITYLLLVVKMLLSLLLFHIVPIGMFRRHRIPAPTM